MCVCVIHDWVGVLDGKGFVWVCSWYRCTVILRVPKSNDTLNDQHSPLLLLRGDSELRFTGTWTNNGAFSVPQVTVEFHFILASNGSFFCFMSCSDSNSFIWGASIDAKMLLFLILIASLMVSMESPALTTIDVCWPSISTLTHKIPWRLVSFHHLLDDLDGCLCCCVPSFVAWWTSGHHLVYYYTPEYYGVLLYQRRWTLLDSIIWVYPDVNIISDFKCNYPVTGTYHISYIIYKNANVTRSISQWSSFIKHSGTGTFQK